MDLLERYLQAIKPLLPSKTQADILRELSDNILSEMEEQEQAQGHPLTESQRAEVIKKHGHPVLVAARYGRPHYLIGPALFPFYWLILRISLVGALVVRSFVAFTSILLSANPPHQIIPAMLEVPWVVVPVFCWITGTFAVLEFAQSYFHLNLKNSWDPKSLPLLTTSSPTVPYAQSIAEIIAGSLAILWWQALPAAPWLALGPVASILVPGPIWTTLHWPILLLIVAGVLQASLNLAQPRVTLARARLRLLIHAYGLCLSYLVLRAGTWVVTAPDLADPAKYTNAVTMVNQLMFYGVGAGVLITGSQFVWECVKYARGSFSRSGLPTRQALYKQ